MHNILSDLRVDLLDEFDRNFERKAFFDKPWADRLMQGKGTLMNTTGKLRRSIKATVQGNGITFTSHAPYATIHNEGGTITVTAKMRRYFWAKYYELSGRVKYRKDGKQSASTQRFSAQAEAYKAMALMKVGSTITIPQRQFIGDHPQVKEAVKRVVDANFKEMGEYLKDKLKP